MKKSDDWYVGSADMHSGMSNGGPTAARTFGPMLWPRFFSLADEALDSLRGEWCFAEISIDHFRLFSDWYGITSGHALLDRIFDAVLDAAESCGSFAGQSGQETIYALLPFDMKRLGELRCSLQKLVSAASEVDSFTVLIGVAPVDGSANDAAEYCNRASLTLSEPQEGGAGNIRLYDAERHMKHLHEYELLNRFRNAIANNEISFFLQPQVRTSTRKIVGAEVLARWHRPDGEWISPGFFVPILEKYGLITQLDRFIWESACKWLRGCIDSGLRPVPISVNVSQIDIRSIDVPVYFDELLKRYSLTPALVHIEITESAYAEDESTVPEAVGQLRSKGFTVFMDDFGSGYSSLNMLRSLNVDVIKLDAQFLRIRDDREEKRKGISIIESMVNMTKNLSVPIVVEGVENENQVQFLSELGCRYMQGYYFYSPMSTDEFENLISRSSRIDDEGFMFKANQELRTREFLDENIYSDTMLNNILGPVAFYLRHGDDVDIVRFNEQFYELVGVRGEAYEERRFRIQRFMPPSDAYQLTVLLDEAEKHWAVGSRGIVGAYRPNGALVYLSLKIFYIDETPQGKRYYVSAQDVTELQVVNAELPGAYLRCALEPPYDFYFISRNFQKLTGFSAKEIEAFFDNKFANLIHPDDLQRVAQQAAAIAAGGPAGIAPFRLRRECGDYIYVAEQSILSDRFGQVCWQVMLLDVTEVMQLRNRMHLLTEYASDTVLFLRCVRDSLKYEVVIHGLERTMGIPAAALEEGLNKGDFCRFLAGGTGELSHQEYTELLVRETLGTYKRVKIEMPGEGAAEIEIHTDKVAEKGSRVEYIMTIRDCRQAQDGGRD